MWPSDLLDIEGFWTEFAPDMVRCLIESYWYIAYIVLAVLTEGHRIGNSKFKSCRSLLSDLLSKTSNEENALRKFNEQEICRDDGRAHKWVKACPVRLSCGSHSANVIRTENHGPYRMCSFGIIWKPPPCVWMLLQITALDASFNCELRIQKGNISHQGDASPARSWWATPHSHGCRMRR